MASMVTDPSSRRGASSTVSERSHEGVPGTTNDRFELEPVLACNLCDSRDHTTHAEKVGAASGLTFRIVGCDECGLLFVNPRLTEAANRQLYDEEYFNGQGFDSSANYVMFDEQEQLREGENRGTIEKIQVLRPGLDARILDIGCGMGSLLRALDHAGYSDVCGLEFSAFAAAQAQRNVRGKVIAADFLEADFGEARFDVIHAGEVIEHLRDPMSFFRRLRALLAPGGVFIYSTGNAAGVYARVLGTRWPYLVPEGHLVYYTPKTMARYFERAGLDVLRDTDLAPEQRAALLRCEDQITYSQLMYVGAASLGMKRHIFRLAQALTSPAPMRRLVTRVVGKHALPIGVRRG